MTKWIYSIVRRLLGLPPNMTLPDCAGITAEVRQRWRGGWPDRAKEKAGAHWQPRAGGKGVRDMQAQDVLPAQRAGFAGCLLPAPETWHHLLGKEPPSSWSFPLPHPWKPMATKLSAAPRDTSPGRESVLSWRPSGEVGTRTLPLSPGTLEARNWAQTRVGR